MNIHPAFVHFPIALLTLYAIFEVVGFGRLRRYAAWFYIKLTLVVSGFLFALLTLQTGELAEQNISRTSSIRAIVNQHSQWANITVFIFGILAAIYLIIWVKDYPECDRVYKKLRDHRFTSKIWKVLALVASRIYHSPLVWILALMGAVAITITGALGGSIVYGPHADPIVELVYKVLGL